MPRSVPDTVNAFVAVVADMAVAVASVFISVWLRFDSGLAAVPFGRPDGVYSAHFVSAFAAAVCTYVAGRRLRLYKRPQRGTFHDKVPRLIKFSLVVMLSLLVLLAVFRNFLTYDVSAGTILIFFPVFAFLLIFERGIIFRMEFAAAAKRPPLNSIVIVGSDSTAVHLAKCFKRDPRLGVNVCGMLLPPGSDSGCSNAGDVRILGKAENFSEVINSLGNVTQLIVAECGMPRDLVYRMASECERRMIRFNVVPDIFFMLTSLVELETVDDVPLLGLRHSPLENPWNRLLKRTEDVFCSLFGLLISSPVILFFGILVKRESPGPVFYKQVRCGYNGRPFTIYKIRTMKKDAEKASGPVFASANDPRRTKIGTWMREHNVDELPQLWNVLRGDMSMVGPRPERPVFVEQFANDIKHYMRRHQCRPGITGWAQVHGLRGNTSIEDRLKFDLWYMENWSLALDLKIMLRTLFAVRNAY